MGAGGRVHEAAAAAGSTACDRPCEACACGCTGSLPRGSSSGPAQSKLQLTAHAARPPARRCTLDISEVPRAYQELSCGLCRQKYGACMQCSNAKCARAFHATCARAAGLRMVNAGGAPGAGLWVLVCGRWPWVLAAGAGRGCWLRVLAPVVVPGHPQPPSTLPAALAAEPEAPPAPPVGAPTQGTAAPAAAPADAWQPTSPLLRHQQQKGLPLSPGPAPPPMQAPLPTLDQQQAGGSCPAGGTPPPPPPPPPQTSAHEAAAADAAAQAAAGAGPRKRPRSGKARKAEPAAAAAPYQLQGWLCFCKQHAATAVPGHVTIIHAPYAEVAQRAGTTADGGRGAAGPQLPAQQPPPPPPQQQQQGRKRARQSEPDAGEEEGGAAAGGSCARSRPADVAHRRHLRAPEAMAAALRKRLYVKALPYLVGRSTRAGRLLPPPVLRGRDGGGGGELSPGEVAAAQQPPGGDGGARPAARSAGPQQPPPPQQQRQQRVAAGEAAVGAAAGPAHARAVGPAGAAAGAAPAPTGAAAGQRRYLSQAERFAEMQRTAGRRLAAGKSAIHGLGALAKVAHRAGGWVGGPGDTSVRCQGANDGAVSDDPK